MKKIIYKIFPFIIPYKSHVIWNIFYNILYALFSTLSFITLIPMMNVLFDKAKKIDVQPVYTDVFHAASYLQDLLYFKITELTKDNSSQMALLLVVSLVILTF